MTQRLGELTDEYLGKLVATNPQATMTYIKELRKSLDAANKRAIRGNSLAECMTEFVKSYESAKACKFKFEVDDDAIKHIKRYL